MLQLIIEDLKQARAYAEDMISHLDPSMWFQLPGSGANPIAWQVGHLAVAQYGLCLKRIRGATPEDTELVPASFLAAFGKGSIPFADVDEYPSIEQLLTVFRAVHERVIEETSQLDLATLEESAGAPHPMFSTKGGALRFSPKHEMLHVGQIAMSRRMLGGESLR